MLRGVDIYFRAQPCMADDTADWIHDEEWGESDERDWVSYCLRPDRGEDGSRRAVFLIGDSHTGALGPGLMTALEGAASVVWISAGFGCGYLSTQFIEVVIGNNEDGVYIGPCKIYNEEIDAQLRQHLKPCDMVVIHHRAWQSQGGMKMQGSPEVHASQVNRLRSLQHLVTSRGAKLVLIGDVGTIPGRGSRCALSSAAEAACEISWSEVVEQNQREHAVYTELAKTPDTYYFKMDHLLCADGMCDAFIPGTSTFAYSDDNHVSTEGAIYLWPFLCAFFEESGLLGVGP